MSRVWIASCAGLAGFAAYVAVVVTLADHLGGTGWRAALYFAVTGVAWVFPARWLMYWAAGRR
ncbi:MAG: DUF2842 domain-containing protein [Acetobacteraceae bacterium]|nr:DUF2842 domain-containing protein [Acetobacteraceae bacterium]